MIHRMKLGAPFVAEVQMTDDEWAAIDPDSLTVEAAIRQGEARHVIAPALDADRKAIVLSFDTAELLPGRAQFDVWVAGGPIPWASNVALDLFRGVAR